MFKERIYKIWKQFTTIHCLVCFHHYCVQRTNIQNLKAIHNLPARRHRGRHIVFKERIYKIWKQFTTLAGNLRERCQLCSKNEYTKSESNSQHFAWISVFSRNCVQRTNIQNLKAIHNPNVYLIFRDGIVFKERIYKIWKQFTTLLTLLSAAHWLCSKNEYTKSESNSQQMWNKYFIIEIVFKERIYKIWKQFTTPYPVLKSCRELCSKNEYTKSESNSQLQVHPRDQRLDCVQRTNIQNLKAIHN